jgi:hypothetical protein
VTRRELDELPLVLSVPRAAALMGMSKHSAYQRIKKDLWPTPVIRFGRVIRIPTAPVVALLCLDDLPRETGEAAHGGAREAVDGT